MSCASKDCVLLCGDEGRVCDVDGAERTSVEGSRQCATDARLQRSRTFEAWKHESTSRAFVSLDVHSTFFYTFANSYLLITLFHSFTFANANGTELRTGRVSISCLPHTLSPFSPF